MPEHCKSRIAALPKSAMTSALMLVSLSPAIAEEVQDDAAALDTVVVTATRTADDALTVPAAIDVIGAMDINRANPKIDLAETLDRVPGVIARDRQNYAQDLQISIRGFGARSTFGVRGVQLYTDGIPATMPDGQGQVSHFSLESAARIEVLRGPFSALYGNSSGGVISLYTADAPPKPLLRIGHAAGNFGLARSSLSFQSPGDEQEYGGVLLDISELDSDGYRDHSAAHRRSAQAMFKGGFGRDGRYTVLFNGLDLDAYDPQGLTAAQLRDDRRAASAGALAFDNRKRVQQDQFGAHIEQDISRRHAFAVTAYRGRRETAQMLSIPVFVQEDPLQGGGAIDLDRDYHGADVRWRWSARVFGQPFSLTSGMEYEVSDERRRGYENFIGERLGVFGALRRDEANRVTGNDVYMQADWELADRWRINAGARYSDIRFESTDRFITAENPDDSGALDYARLSPVAGVLFRVTPQLSLYANAGEGFETPAFSELAYRNDGRSGLNDRLDSATSTNVEIGLRARQDALDVSAAAFQARTKDELVVVANEGGRSVYGNAGVSRRRGFEFALSGEVTPRWHYDFAYTFLDARYLHGFSAENDGRRIPGLPRHVAWSELAWNPADGTDVVLEARFVDRVYVNDENTEAARAYARFDLGVEQRFIAGGLEWRAFARLDNLLGREYVGSVIVNEGNGRYYEPAPGRNWMIGVVATGILD